MKSEGKERRERGLPVSVCGVDWRRGEREGAIDCVWGGGGEKKIMG